MQIISLIVGVFIIGILVIMYRTDKELEKVRRRTESYLEGQHPQSK